jgi:energy-converting hydrogenase Eha subunit B
MTRPIALALALLAGPALAEDPKAAANALILPMIQELIPGRDGQVVAACVVAVARPDETARLAAAPGPSTEIGALITEILHRPETIGCIQATKAQG